MALLQTLALIQQSEEEEEEGVQISSDSKKSAIMRGRRGRQLDSKRTVYILFIKNDSFPSFI